MDGSKDWVDGQKRWSKSCIAYQVCNHAVLIKTDVTGSYMPTAGENSCEGGKYWDGPWCQRISTSKNIDLSNDILCFSWCSGPNGRKSHQLMRFSRDKQPSQQPSLKPSQDQCLTITLTQKWNTTPPYKKLKSHQTTIHSLLVIQNPLTNTALWIMSLSGEFMHSNLNFSASAHIWSSWTCGRTTWIRLTQYHSWLRDASNLASVHKTLTYSRLKKIKKKISLPRTHLNKHIP